MKKLFLLGCLVIVSIIVVALGLPVASFAAPIPVYDDLWDISAGTVVTGSSTILNHGGSSVSASRDMFGGTLSMVEPGNTIFEDWFYYKGDQWITWRTQAPVTVGSLNLFSAAYNAQRSFSWFKLYADGNPTPIVDFTPTTSFDGIYTKTFTPVTAQDFRAEFGWAEGTGWTTDDINWARSVRVIELDGFAPDTVNAPPVNTVPVTPQVVPSHVVLVLSISTTDEEAAADNQPVQVSLTVAHGTLSLSRNAGLTFQVGTWNNAASMTFQGLLGAVNAAMDGMIYQPTSSYFGPDTLTITTSDLGYIGGTVSDPTAHVVLTDPTPCRLLSCLRKGHTRLMTLWWKHGAHLPR